MVQSPFSRKSRELLLLEDIDRKVGAILAAQDDIQTAASTLVSVGNAIQAVATDLTAAEANIKNAIAALEAQIQAAGAPVDTTALNQAVAGIAAPLAALQSADAAVDALETPPAPPA